MILIVTQKGARLFYELPVVVSPILSGNGGRKAPNTLPNTTC